LKKAEQKFREAIAQPAEDFMVSSSHLLLLGKNLRRLLTFPFFRGTESFSHRCASAKHHGDAVRSHVAWILACGTSATAASSAGPVSAADGCAGCRRAAGSSPGNHEAFCSCRHGNAAVATNGKSRSSQWHLLCGAGAG
jgi:hypothetical protein